MKKLYFILLLALLTSCEKYNTECATATLSGKYVISVVKIQSVKQNTSRDTTLHTGDLCLTKMPPPFDSFRVDGFQLHLDYSSIEFPYIGTSSTGRDIYKTKTFYSIYNCTPYYVGDLQFNYNYDSTNITSTFYIEDDGFEHLQIKSKGVWPYGKWGEDVMYTFFLTRVGP
jgi:hypothetical protein